ncbi:type II secretion system protein [Salinibacterium hongtaonis]|uniref:type II secretion system protein n=1 Tax=Homoserinimonas hongtaonis TaxID=2079791 RepID=UPI000D36F6D0|nr:prepilin-type N-terminal cleavage/methylation domain-containing protein [Salinibacterium hongtaonis]AWB90012.1 prepilin-type cleavage/methylation domain-containing protein [Salinibacterium hongtaonis]
MITRINQALDASRLKREENEKGFTLIELLVVVIIIGILAAIAIPVFLNQRESAWKSSVESDLKNVALALESYAAENNGSISTLPATITITSTTPSTDLPSAKVSADNTVTVTKVGTNGYEIVGGNTNLGAKSLKYDSAAGGLQDWNNAGTSGGTP